MFIIRLRVCPLLLLKTRCGICNRAHVPQPCPAYRLCLRQCAPIFCLALLSYYYLCIRFIRYTMRLVLDILLKVFLRYGNRRYFCRYFCRISGCIWTTVVAWCVLFIFNILFFLRGSRERSFVADTGD